mmetsp:Transcript_11181/g.36811  ORF Transcript_11181/g.36811 Transcript_11181/m.36811 type:complete len:207 (-) Transcript_11181:756-1376(-)
MRVLNVTTSGLRSVSLISRKMSCARSCADPDRHVLMSVLKVMRSGWTWCSGIRRISSSARVYCPPPFSHAEMSELYVTRSGIMPSRCIRSNVSIATAVASRVAPFAHAEMRALYAIVLRATFFSCICSITSCACCHRPSFASALMSALYNTVFASTPADWLILKSLSAVSAAVSVVPCCCESSQSCSGCMRAQAVMSCEYMKRSGS